MAAAGISPICYNHPEKRADFKCFDCKYESIINLCAQCNIQVHSLDVFRAHKVELLEVKAKERRLSQDVSDIEKLIEVENDLLKNVLTKLKYTEAEEKEALSQLIHLQNAAKKRIAEIKDCETKIEKAFNYLAKVSSMLAQCSSPVGDGDDKVKKDPFAVPIETTSTDQEPPIGSVVDSSDQLSVEPPPDLVAEDQKGPPEESHINLPDELKGKDVFPVCVVGSLARDGSFWIAKIGEVEMEKQRQIQVAIRKYFLQHGFGDAVVLKEGALCAVLHRQVKEFCRARIEVVTTAGKAKLRFLDLGIVDEFSPSSLCQLPLDVVDISYQALECCLLPDPETQLPYEAKWCFKDLTFNKILMASVEGQVTDKKGRVLYHVMLGSCGEIPVCINSKVAKLVEDQKHGLEDRPLQPKAEKVETVEVVDGDNTVKQHTLETPGNIVEDTVPKMDTTCSSSTSEEEETLAKTDTETSVTDQVAADVHKIDVPVEENDNVGGEKPVLRAEAAEFVPVSPESERSSSKKFSLHSALEQNNVPGVLHLPVQDKAVSVMPVNAFDRYNNTVPDNHLPAGCVDFATYNQILTKCSFNLICKEDLPRARFVMIRSDIRRIVEGMKFNIWCSAGYCNKRLNRIFSEAASRDNSPVFLLFSGMRTSMFCGMAEMVSAVDFTKSCPKLNDPFKFGSKMSGRCDIKWIYASNVYFADVITPNCGFSRRHLEDATDGYEIVNKLGQMIVCAFDSRGNFESILQQAMKDHQFYAGDQLENRDRKSYEYDTEPLKNTHAGPSWNAAEDTSNGFPELQEDWDQEIEESLKAAKQSEADQVDESSVQEAPKDILSETVETDLSVVSEAVTDSSLEDASLQADTSAATSCGPVLSIKSNEIVSGDGDSVTASDGEEVVITNSDDTHDQEGTCAVPDFKEGYDEQEKGPDEDVGLLSVGSMEGQSPVEASQPSSQEMEADGSPPKERQDDVNEDHKIEPTELNQDGYLDSADESVHTVPRACNSSGVEANEDDLDPWEESAIDPSLVDDEVRSCDREPKQDDYHDPAIESVHTVHSEHSSSGYEANEYGPDAWEDSSANPSLLDVVFDDSNIVAGGSSVSECHVNGDPVLKDLCSQEVLSHGSSEDLLSDYEDLPVEIGKEHWIVATESMSSSGTFWARVVRTSKEEACFLDDMKRMGAHTEANNRPLDPNEIHLYKQCAVKGLDDFWYRALVEKTLDKGKIYIRLLDVGESWEVHQKDLRILDDEFYASPPAQAFECSICYENPNSRKEKTRISKLIKKNKKLRVLVKNVSREGTVGVQVLP